MDTDPIFRVCIALEEALLLKHLIEEDNHLKCVCVFVCV